MRDRRGAIAQSTLDILAEEVALLDVDGIGIRPMAVALQEKHPDLPITQNLIKSLKHHEKYKDMHLAASAKLIQASKLEWKLGTAKLVPKTLRAINACLEEGGHAQAMKAASIVFSSVEDKDDDGNKQAQQINIMLASDTLPVK